MPQTLNVAETDYVIFQVKGIDLSSNSYVNPTSSALQVGFVSSSDGGQVAPTEWFPGQWIANVLAEFYYASCLIGPDGVTTLAAGSWVPWCSFPLGAAMIVRPCADTLTMLA